MFGIPTAAGGGEEDVFKGGVGTTEGTHAEVLSDEGAEELFAEFLVALGAEGDGGETLGVGFAGGGDFEGGFDGRDECG